MLEVDKAQTAAELAQPADNSKAAEQPSSDLGTKPDAATMDKAEATAAEQAAAEEAIKFTEAQQKKIDQIITDRLKKAEEKHQKQLEEAERLKQMNAEEKATYERTKLEGERDELKKRIARYEMGAEATAMLTEQGITASSAVLDAVVKETAEATKEAVTNFVKIVNDAAEALTRQKLAGTAPKVSTSQGKVKTKADIMAIKDPKERLAQIQQNPDLF